MKLSERTRSLTCQTPCGLLGEEGLIMLEEELDNKGDKLSDGGRTASGGTWKPEGETSEGGVFLREGMLA